MDRLGIARAVFAGASMGGAIAALTAARSPARVAGLALFAPSGVMRDLELPGIAGRIQSSPVLSAIARTLVRIPGYGVLFPLNLARQSLTLTASYNDAFVAALDSIRAPTMLMWSAGDARVAMAASRTYLRHIPGARLVTAPDSLGHNLLQDADAAARMICKVATPQGRSGPGFANSSFLRKGTPSVIHFGAGASMR
jgi:pimeloyl-ACP methyl ester carboxylesterase